VNEAQTRAELIDRALHQAGWGVVENSRIRREEIAKGRLIGGGKRETPKYADYVLIYRNQKLAVIEAKKRDLPVTEGLQQAKEYAERLQTPFAYSTNGLGIYEVNMIMGEEKEIDRYPTPQELWQRIHTEENEWLNRFADIPFEDKSGTWQMRYYQYNAINKVLEAIALSKDRILLTMATGTGKTCVAFQIAWKLFNSRWNISRKPNRRPRILFLADRNILADQAFNAFSAFPHDALVRINPKDINKTGGVPKNRSIFFTIFQTFMTKSSTNEEDEQTNLTDTFRFYDYEPDFFDLIIIDECHRGGANDESTWRGILEYFASAVQLGLTATPKRDNNTDTYNYFGEPVYRYSLKEGINDGYLTPFKVKQIETTLDEYSYNEEDIILAGSIDQNRIYTEKDFNRIIEMRPREAYRIKLLLSSIAPNEKTIIFCANQRHALMIRDLVNQMKSNNDPNYCVRVTANDGELGEQYLRAFQDNDKNIPTILTTSRKLSTGVDARNARNIVLLRPINSMIEFKQIIGRGTRLYDGKDYFTIYDYVKAYEHFNDREWDGEPEAPTPITPRENNLNETNQQNRESGNEEKQDRSSDKIIIQLGDGREREIEYSQKTSFWTPEGIPITATEFIERLYGDIPELFKDETELRIIWSRPDTRKSLLKGLADKGYGEEALTEISRIIDAEKSDIYDVLAYIAYAHKPITRQERVRKHQHLIFSRYTGKQQEFLDFVLNHYITAGVGELDQGKLPKLLELKYHTINDAIANLGKVKDITEIFINFQKYLYNNQETLYFFI
jgi:type I restriction enzyme R subunit